MVLSLPSSGSASADSIAELVEEYGNLPRSYLEFLKIHDGTVPPENVLRGSDDRIGVRSFLPASEIVDRAQTIEGLPSRFIPIAEDDMGNYICICANDHKIFFWNHEVEIEERVADNFEMFLKGLEPFDFSKLDLDSEKARIVWSDPDFKPEF
jgi:hypothetical protein